MPRYVSNPAWFTCFIPNQALSLQIVFRKFFGNKKNNILNIYYISVLKIYEQLIIGH